VQGLCLVGISVYPMRIQQFFEAYLFLFVFIL
jgi:hypothetical protein